MLNTARNHNHAAYDALRRLAFSMLRARQPIHLVDAMQVSSDRRVRMRYVGDLERGRYFLENFYGRMPATGMVGSALVGPFPSRFNVDGVPCDFEVVEINRLYVSAYRRAGYLAIPEWVEFGRTIVPDKDTRYAEAGKSLRCDLRAVQRGEFTATFSRESADFALFYDRMYRPFTAERFGAGAIEKPRIRLWRDFQAGFLLLIHGLDGPVAGGLVREGVTDVNLTTIGATSAVEGHTRSRALACIDYHLHAWAADHGKTYLGVGHTRPFPTDGVYFNKRKWLMSIEPDSDGVANLAFRWSGDPTGALNALRGHPFVYQANHGLGVFCVEHKDHPLNFNEARKLLKQQWTPGLASLIAVCAGGFEPGVPERIGAECGERVILCDDLATGLHAYQFRV